MKHLLFSHFGLKSDTLSFLLWASFLLKSSQLMPRAGHLSARGISKDNTAKWICFVSRPHAKSRVAQWGCFMSMAIEGTKIFTWRPTPLQMQCPFLPQIAPHIGNSHAYMLLSPPGNGRSFQYLHHSTMVNRNPGGVGRESQTADGKDAVICRSTSNLYQCSLVDWWGPLSKYYYCFQKESICSALSMTTNLKPKYFPKAP